MNTDELLEQIISSGVSVSGPLDIGKLTGTSIAVNAGLLDNGTQRITLATDDINVNSIKTNIDNSSYYADPTGEPTFNALRVQQWFLGDHNMKIAIHKDNADYGTQRVCIADNDTNLSSINTNTTSMASGINVAQVRGNAVTINSGIIDNGTQRVCIATDDVNLAILSAGVSSSKYQSNVSQINGVAPSMNSGVNGTGVQRVTVATDDALNTKLTTINTSITSVGTNTANLNSLTHIPDGTGSVFASGISTVNCISVRNEAESTLVNADNRYSVLTTDRFGQLYVNSRDLTTMIDLTNSISKLRIVQSDHNGNNIDATGSGVNGSTVQRVSIATDDVNLAILSGGVTSSKYQSNVSQINGVAPSMGSGVNGTGVQRMTIATDDTNIFNMVQLLTDKRYLTTNYQYIMLGGKNTNMLSSDWVCIPNDSSSTWNETNTEPCRNASPITYDAADADDDGSNNGAVSFRYNYYVSTGGTTLNQGSSSINGQTYNITPSPAVWDIVKMWVQCNSTVYNTGDIVLKNSTTSKAFAFIPAHVTFATPFSVTLPALSTALIFLDKLDCSSLDFTNANRGFRVKIVYRITGNSSWALTYEIVLFSTSILNQKHNVFDLSSLPPIYPLQGASNISFMHSVHLFVKGGNDGDGNTSPTSGSCFLTLKVRRN